MTSLLAQIGVVTLVAPSGRFCMVQMEIALHSSPRNQADLARADDWPVWAVQRIQDAWRAQLGRVRSGSATHLLLRSLPGAPVLTVNGAAELIRRSFPQTNEAVARPTRAGVLSQVTAGRRNRAFEVKETINAFTDLEQQLASPAGDTRNSEPSRTVPCRP